MKIAYISTSIIPSRAANSIHVMKMCQALASYGNDVTLFVPLHIKGVEAEVDDIYEYYGVERKFKVTHVPTFPLIQEVLHGPMAMYQVNKFDPDLVFSRDLKASFVASLLNIPVVFEAHEPVSDMGLFNDWILASLIDKPSFRSLITITHSLKDYYLEKFPSLRGKVQVAADGADSVPESTEPHVFSHDPNRLQVGYIGHLYRGRGIDIIEKMAERCDWADFHIIGGTEADIVSRKREVRSLTNLHFHGFQPPSEADRYRLGVDVLVAPYKHDAQVAGGRGKTVNWMSPLKVFEYMSAGKAIICSDLPVLHEVLEDGRNAVLCDPYDIDQWVSALHRLRDNEEERFALGQNAKSDFLKKYTWRSRARTIMDSLDI